MLVRYALQKYSVHMIQQSHVASKQNDSFKGVLVKTKIIKGVGKVSFMMPMQITILRISMNVVRSFQHILFFFWNDKISK